MIEASSIIRIGGVSIDVSHPKAFASNLEKYCMNMRYALEYDDGFRTKQELEWFKNRYGLDGIAQSIEEMAGQVDVGFIQCIIKQGLTARHRNLRFTATLLDKPGNLVKLLNNIAEQGANILTVEHDRLSAALDPNQTDVHIACEVGGKEHGERLINSLKSKGFKIRINY